MNIKLCLILIEWRKDTRNSYDEIDVYNECRYVVVSTIGRNHVKMATTLFDYHYMYICVGVNLY